GCPGAGLQGADLAGDGATAVGRHRRLPHAVIALGAPEGHRRPPGAIIGPAVRRPQARRREGRRILPRAVALPGARLALKAVVAPPGGRRCGLHPRPSRVRPGVPPRDGRNRTLLPTGWDEKCSSYPGRGSAGWPSVTGPGLIVFSAGRAPFRGNSAANGV